MQDEGSAAFAAFNRMANSSTASLLSLNNTSTSAAAAADKRRRTSRIRSCEACRKRKTKCDITPFSDTCSYCRSTGKPCNLERTRKLPPQTYTQALEDQIQVTTSLLKSISASCEVDLLSVLQEPELYQRLMDFFDEQASQTPVRMSHPYPAGKAAEDPAFLPPRTTSLPSPSPITEGTCTDTPSPDGQSTCASDASFYKNERFVGRGSVMYLGCDISTTFGQMIPGPVSILDNEVDQIFQLQAYSGILASCESFQIMHRQLWGGTPTLPPRDLLMTLVDAYFTHINRYVPLLHRPSFELILRVGATEFSPSFRSLVFGVIALGARWVSDPRIPSCAPSDSEKPLPGLPYFIAASADAVLAAKNSDTTLFDLQSAVVAIMFLYGSSHLVQIWLSLGMTLRRFIDYGVHIERQQRWCESPLTDQLRKRCFYTLLIIDQSVSVLLGRPVAIAREDYDLQYPLDLSDDALDAWDKAGGCSPPGRPPPPGPITGLTLWYETLVFTVDLVRDFEFSIRRSRIERDLLPMVLAFDRRLRRWMETVPPAFCDIHNADDANVIPSAYIYLHFFFCQMCLHKQFFPNMRLVSGRDETVYIAMAQECILILKVLISRGLLHDAYYLSPVVVAQIGLVFLKEYLLEESARSDDTPGRVIRDGLETALVVLHRLSDSNPGAEKVYLNLLDIVVLLTKKMGVPSVRTPTPAVDDSQAFACHMWSSSVEAQEIRSIIRPASGNSRATSRGQRSAREERGSGSRGASRDPNAAGPSAGPTGSSHTPATHGSADGYMKPSPPAAGRFPVEYDPSTRSNDPNAGFAATEYDRSFLRGLMPTDATNDSTYIEESLYAVQSNIFGGSDDGVFDRLMQASGAAEDSPGRREVSKSEQFLKEVSGLSSLSSWADMPLEFHAAFKTFMENNGTIESYTAEPALAGMTQLFRGLTGNSKQTFTRSKMSMEFEAQQTEWRFREPLRDYA